MSSISSKYENGEVFGLAAFNANVKVRPLRPRLEKIISHPFNTFKPFVKMSRNRA
jgi:hypothetical protein